MQPSCNSHTLGFRRLPPPQSWPSRVHTADTHTEAAPGRRSSADALQQQPRLPVSPPMPAGNRQPTGTGCAAEPVRAGWHDRGGRLRRQGLRNTPYAAWHTNVTAAHGPARGCKQPHMTVLDWEMWRHTHHTPARHRHCNGSGACLRKRLHHTHDPAPPAHLGDARQGCCCWGTHAAPPAWPQGGTRTQRLLVGSCGDQLPRPGGWVLPRCHHRSRPLQLAATPSRVVAEPWCQLQTHTQPESAWD